jgi:hypothetical protein
MLWSYAFLDRDRAHLRNLGVDEIPQKKPILEKLGGRCNQRRLRFRRSRNNSGFEIRALSSLPQFWKSAYASSWNISAVFERDFITGLDQEIGEFCRLFALVRSNDGLCSTSNGFTFKAAALSDDCIGDLYGIVKAPMGKKDRVHFNGKYGKSRCLGWGVATGKNCGVLPNKCGSVPYSFVTTPTILWWERELPSLYPLVYSFTPPAFHNKASCR